VVGNDRLHQLEEVVALVLGEYRGERTTDDFGSQDFGISPLILELVVVVLVVRRDLASDARQNLFVRDFYRWFRQVEDGLVLAD